MFTQGKKKLRVVLSKFASPPYQSLVTAKNMSSKSDHYWHLFLVVFVQEINGPTGEEQVKSNIDFIFSFLFIFLFFMYSLLVNIGLRNLIILKNDHWLIVEIKASCFKPYDDKEPTQDLDINFYVHKMMPLYHGEYIVVYSIGCIGLLE